tara:strand:- start:9 stop:386 length:378 start_codon:yes stop_codon:yes gene_type:complete
MASDSILTSIPFWIVIGVIFVLAVAYAVCVGTRVNPFKECGRCWAACGNCGRGVWTTLTCCCPAQDAEKVEKPKDVKKDEDLEQALDELVKLRDTLPLLPLKRDECKADKKNYLLERAERTPTVI